jgi:hypothetical protein
LCPAFAHSAIHPLNNDTHIHINEQRERSFNTQEDDGVKEEEEILIQTGKLTNDEHPSRLAWRRFELQQHTNAELPQ